ncbi:MAG: uroporphyrinogen-III synthase [Balneolales bacterium]
MTKQSRSNKNAEQPLSGINTVCFESRLAESAASLIEKYGARVISAPSMQEVPLEDHHEVFRFAERLFSGEIDILICTTGVGTRMMTETLQARYRLDDIRRGFQDVILVARGPKPVGVLKKYGIRVDVAVPEPNTWQEILSAMDADDKTSLLAGKQVAIQEYGETNPELVTGLQNRGAETIRIPVYRWMLPEDVNPLLQGLRAVLDGKVHIALFTSKTQINHVMQVARRENMEQPLLAALNKCLIASIGPVCTRGLKEQGIHVDFEPSRSKLAIFIRELSVRAPGMVTPGT